METSRIARNTLVIASLVIILLSGSVLWLIIEIEPVIQGLDVVVTFISGLLVFFLLIISINKLIKKILITSIISVVCGLAAGIWVNRKYSDQIMELPKKIKEISETAKNVLFIPILIFSIVLAIIAYKKSKS